MAMERKTLRKGVGVKMRVENETVITIDKNCEVM